MSYQTKLERSLHPPSLRQDRLYLKLFNTRSSDLLLRTSSDGESFRRPAPTCNYPYHLLVSSNVSSIFPSPQFNYIISYAIRSDQYHISSFLYALATYIKSVWNLI